MFTRQDKNKIIEAIKHGDKTTGSDTLNLMYEFVQNQDEYGTLSAVAVAALNEREIKTWDDIEAIKKNPYLPELRVYLSDIVRKWIEKKGKK